MPKAKPFSATPNVDSDTFDELHPKVTTHRKKREKPEEAALDTSPPTVFSSVEEAFARPPEGIIEDPLREQASREQQRLFEAQRADQEAQQRVAAAEGSAPVAQQQARVAEVPDPPHKEEHDPRIQAQPTAREAQKAFPPKKAGAKRPPTAEPEEERRLTVRVSTQISQKLVMLSEALGIDETGCMRLGLIELWERHVRAGLLPSPRDTTL